MVQTRHQKSKQKKVKKHGKQTDITELRSLLDALGLKIIQVTADGNCFFRALADQLEGNEENHQNYRAVVVDYIKKNREMFEPFIEDEVPFDEYCDTMGKDGTWAGHMELQAASLVTQNVRSKEDPCGGPAMPIIIKADANISATSHQPNSAEPLHSNTRGSGGDVHYRSIKMVISGSGCEDMEKVKQILEQVDGDVDSAIEFLIAKREAEMTSDGGDRTASPTNSNVTKSENEKDHADPVDANYKKVEVGDIRQKAKGDSSTCKDDKKKIPRNKVCPCGSKKKYKNCCGAASAKTISKSAVDDIEDLPKGKKGKKLGKKGTVPDVMCHGSDITVSDLGALCI